MMLESQEIDMTTIGGDMMPWLEYLPQDVLNFFDGNGNSIALAGDSSIHGSVDLNTMSSEGG